MEPIEPTDELVGDGTGEALPEIDDHGCYDCDGAGCQGCEAGALNNWVAAHPLEPGIVPPKPDYRVIDNNTGELVQLSLLGAEWEQYKVETLRLSLSGGDEFIKELFDQLVDGELSPGAIVEVVCRGVVKEHAPIYKKDGHEGKTVINLEVVRRITVIGHMTGKVEAAQNVDGEAKVMEEGAGMAQEDQSVESDEMVERPECFGEPDSCKEDLCDACPILSECMASVAESEDLEEAADGE
jgi:hypothetical protein